MNLYKVLWFDDQCETLPEINDSAYENKIDLVGFKDSETGIRHLKENISLYHAVLLDGKFYQNPDQVGDDLSENALGEVIRELSRLEHIRILPYFILSGDKTFIEKDNSLLTGISKQKKVYSKWAKKDLEELWLSIKAEADNEEVNKIKNQYQPVFNIFNGRLLDPSYESQIINLIITSISDHYLDCKGGFNGIRRILEHLFSNLNKLGFIPDSIMDSNQWFNPSSRFLCDNHNEYEFREKIISPAIQFQIKNLVLLCQDASHELKNKLSIAVSDHVTQNKTNYLFNSALFMLFDVLVYFDGLIATRQYTNQSLPLWIEKEDWIEGEIQRVAENKFGTFFSPQLNRTVSIPPHMMADYSIGINDAVKVIINSDYRIQRLKIIEQNV
jgi:hypothetical protein